VRAGTVPYFAYGSNMGLTALRERCPSARQLGIARVEGYRLGFTRYSKKRGGGVADLVPAPGRVVWGALFDVGDELELLDGFEGVPTAYRRELWKVTTPEGSVLEAWVYVVAEKVAEMLPSREYWELLVEGAREAGLSAEYVAEIERIAHLP
jgi:gamma-glutamylcyclotransferase (GGCT)/AIG2-like uncharacterized protein YtfP